MNYLYSIIFGIVQGITEFLPISSSGHLVILHNIIKIPIRDEMAFDVFLHLATLLSLLYFFRKDVWLLLKSWVLSFVGKKSEASKLSWLIFVATIPAVIFGLLFNDYIEKNLHEGSSAILIVAIAMAVVGALFILAEKYSKKISAISELNQKKSILIGFSQAIALIPGVSRSGITIISGLFVNLKREEAVKFSFLLSMPIIFGASVKNFPDMFNAGMNAEELKIAAVAFVFCFFAGLAAIKYLLLFSRNNKLNVFAYYRFALAFALVIWYIVKL
ncbi:MAG: undecaprenyl-diphosphate phosphatase [bacterium]